MFDRLLAAAHLSADDRMLWMAAAAVGGALLGVLATACWDKSRATRRHAPSSLGKKMKVYHKKTFRSSRILWMVNEMGVSDDFEFVPFNPYIAGEEERAWYRANVHPHGTVPALVDDTGKVLVESGAICMYLAQLYDQLLPPTDMSADYFDWCVYAAATVDPCLTTIHREIELTSAEQNKSLLDKALADVDTFARRLDSHLDGRDYICGKYLTVADVIVGYCVMWASIIKGGRIIADFPNVKSYLGRLKARPHFNDTMGTAREWIMSNEP